MSRPGFSRWPRWAPATYCPSAVWKPPGGGSPWVNGLNAFWTASAPAPQTPRRHYRGQRIFLVGDTAHLNPPWGGHGVNTCVGDAVNIGWKLAAVIQGWASTGLLDSYQPERRPVAQRTIGAAGRQEAFLAASFAAEDLDADGPTGKALRAAVAGWLQVKDPEFHSLGPVLGYDYPDSPVVVPDGRPQPANDVVRFTPSAHPGARLPHHWLLDGLSVYDLLGDGFTLLQLDADADVASLVEVAERMSVPLRTMDLSRFPQLRADYEAALLLVRPDQHVAWRGGSVDAPEALLARVVGTPWAVRRSNPAESARRTLDQCWEEVGDHLRGAPRSPRGHRNAAAKGPIVFAVHGRTSGTPQWRGRLPRAWQRPGTRRCWATVGELLAEEAVRKGVDVVPGPTVNVHRTSLAGERRADDGERSAHGSSEGGAGLRRRRHGPGGAVQR